MQNQTWRQYISKFNQNDEELTIQAISNENAEEWVEKEVPKFECSDELIEETYYFRWWVFRKHIKEIDNGRVITEFLPKVSWSGPHNSINCANGHHIAEARWLKEDRTLAKDDIYFWLRGEGKENVPYSSWIADAVYHYALASDDKELAVDVLPELIQYYEMIEKKHLTKYGLFWSHDGWDAMEESISGSGLRPTMNSYMYANARAIEKISLWAGDEQTSQRFREKAETIRELMWKHLWDEKDQFFKVIPQATKDDEIPDLAISSIPKEHNAMEEIGYIPWGFGVPDKRHNKAWRYLADEEYFKAPYGITTAQKNHPRYMNKESSHECQWNGPIWPYATTQTLNGMIKLLESGETEEVKKADFAEQLSIYAKSHFRTDENGKTLNWLDENMHPDTGIWLAREMLQGWGWNEDKGGYERGKDYNHSAFCDLVIRGICGLQPTEDNQIVVDPLISKEGWTYFLLEDLPYKKHKLTIGYDKDGSRYQKGKGLWIELDGREIARASELGKLVGELS